MLVTISTLGILETRMVEREGHKISDHAIHSDNEYEAERMVIGPTKRQLHRDDSSLNACNYQYGRSFRDPNGGTRKQ